MKSEEKLAVHELLYRAAYGYDSHNVEMLTECFVENAVMTLRVGAGDLIGPYDGQEAIVNFMKRAMKKQTDKRLHQISNIFFENEGEDEATTLSSLTLFATENGVCQLLSTGIYRDEVVKVDGRWRISKRHLDIELPV
ncbi:nuclear transport factor 2 family protein [Bacillus sp. B15-48]|uniref:nuclear transport factor 2 family protein n=1 Tax=Bacillus sp. B15-48 TaxID=1548601 RepID=UPI00193FFB8F|nr:nuclear transport factor 2 family protein [Bacillus sp. B15-48]MBM4761821.1 nuclear transport factor 2 family protein [Bacillus sp. B15-48]